MTTTNFSATTATTDTTDTTDIASRIFSDSSDTDNLSGNDATSQERSLISYSAHARCRACQRNLDPRTVQYVLDYGRIIHRTGAIFYFLGARDIARYDPHNKWARQRIGTVLVMSLDGQIITLYRNPDAQRTIRRKMKYRSTPGWPSIQPTEPEPMPQAVELVAEEDNHFHHAA